MTVSLLRMTARGVAALGLVLIVLASVAGPASADDEEPGIGLSVPVIGPTASPPVVSTTGPTGRVSAVSARTASVTTDVAPPVPAATDMLIAGGLYVSDINGSSRPSANPLEGVADAWITLRNLSSETIDLRADFSIATFSGAFIAGSEVDVRALKAGESRVVGAALSGTGQWPFVVARVTVVPPEIIAGQQTASVSRAAIVYVFPWLAAIGLVLAAVAFVVLRVAARPAVLPLAA